MATYGTEPGVEALVPGIGSITASTIPTIDQVGDWLAEGYAVINRYIVGAGYAIPIASSAALYDELAALNNLYAAAHALRARFVDTVTGEDEDRSEVWLNRFHLQCKEMAASNLEALGATVLTSTDAARVRRRRIRSMQLRRIDGYSGTYEGETAEYDNPSE